MPACKACAFWSSTGDTGECRFWPPAYVVPHGWIFPITGANEWCGQHQPLAAKDEETKLDGR